MNYIERMKDEIEELTNKIYKLATKLEDENFKKEIGEKRTNLLAAQFYAMTAYRMILQIRIDEETK